MSTSEFSRVKDYEVPFNDEKSPGLDPNADQKSA